MGMTAIFFNVAETFEQIVNIPLWNLEKIGQAVSEKKVV